MKAKNLLTIISSILFTTHISFAEVTSYKMLRVLHVEPLSYVDDHGKILGFESDLITEIERRAGIELHSEVASSIKQGFEDVKSGKADIMAAALSITPEREQTYLFSEPYFIANPITIITKDENIKSWQDLKEKKVSVQGGSTHEKWLRELKGNIPNDESIHSVPTSFLGVKEVIQNKSDATINDDIIILGYVNTYKKYGLHAKIVDVFGQDQIAFLINKNKPELKQHIDNIIKEMKVDGTIDKFVKKWWGDLFSSQ